MAHRNLANLLDMLQCDICMEEFQADGTKNPKMLPCQHSFCMMCLSKLAKSVGIECPVCRNVCRKRATELPNNLLLLQLIDLVGASHPGAALPSEVPVDCVATMQKYLREPTKLLPELRLYHQGPEPTEFKVEHLSVILQCLEQYVQTPLQQPDVLVVCMQIMEGMMKFAKSMSDYVKERLRTNTMDVLMASNIQPAVQVTCINILYSLATSKVEENRTCTRIKILFGHLDKTTQNEVKIKLVFVLRSFIHSLQRIEKEDIGSGHNVKKLLDIIKSNWSVDEHLDVVLAALVDLTASTTTPCTNIVEMGGLDHLERILKGGSQSKDVLESTVKLVNNISEVPKLIKVVIKRRVLMEALVTQLQSESTSISLLSAKIIARLCLVQAPEWLQLCGGDTRKRALTNLHKQVLAWIEKDPGTMKFQDNSFGSLFPLLQMYSAPPCQLYAAWYLRKCCNDDKERCHERLIKEDGLSILRDIKENEYADKALREVVSDILTSISPDSARSEIRLTPISPLLLRNSASPHPGKHSLPSSSSQNRRPRIPSRKNHRPPPPPSQ